MTDRARRRPRRTVPAAEPLEARRTPGDLGVIGLTVTNDGQSQQPPVDALPPVSTLDQIDLNN